MKPRSAKIGEIWKKNFVRDGIEQITLQTIPKYEFFWSRIEWSDLLLCLFLGDFQVTYGVDAVKIDVGAAKPTLLPFA